MRDEQDDAGVVDGQGEGGCGQEGRGGPEDEVEDGSEREGGDEEVEGGVGGEGGHFFNFGGCVDLAGRS